MRNIASVLCALAFTAIAAPAAHAQAGSIQSIPKAHSLSPKAGSAKGPGHVRKAAVKTESEVAPAAPTKSKKMSASGAKMKKRSVRKGKQAKTAKPRAKRVARPRDGSGRFMKTAKASRMQPTQRKVSTRRKVGRAKVAFRGSRMPKGRNLKHHSKIAHR